MILLEIPTTLFDAAVAPAIMGAGFAGMSYLIFHWVFGWL